MATWEEFQQAAQKVSNETGFPLSVMLGQAALETGRGTSSDSQSRNNWFGTGAYDSDPNKAFTFDSPEDSIRYYVNNITKLVPNWKQMVNDPASIVQGIKNAGYASDPQYVQKVLGTQEFQQNGGTVPANFKNVNPQLPNQQQINPQTPNTGKDFHSIMGGIMDKIHSPAGGANNPTAQYQNNNVQQQNPTATYVQNNQRSQSPTGSYTVQPGDTLWGIAQKYLGGGNNYGQIKGYSGNPNELQSGTKLTL